VDVTAGVKREPRHALRRQGVPRAPRGVAPATARAAT